MPARRRRKACGYELPNLVVKTHYNDKSINFIMGVTMRYYNANQASRELGIARQEIVKMIRNKELKAERKNGGTYCIPASEIKRLNKKLEQQEAELDKEFSNTAKTTQRKKVKYYTATQASEKLGIERHIIMRLIRNDRIDSIKGQYQRSPYRIPETQLQKLYELATSEIANKEQEASNTKIETKPIPNHTPTPQPYKYYDDFLQIQKNISETMRHLASTQEQIAFTLAQLLKKV